MEQETHHHHHHEYQGHHEHHHHHHHHHHEDIDINNTKVSPRHMRKIARKVLLYTTIAVAVAVVLFAFWLSFGN